ncbi:hypothetical protein [Salinicoccus halitifaciens]|uniref:Uncharacterized protein n=1 Tax=Salinicoccus halitifaciens TaxID=1073415 RepID=A0ABV2EBC6_9STAP|nr:hypothetical protein [Salinicoccus halitifaciens]MCD2138954.1 hypothetical protein [Salinicoccus halitifaciens]
MFKFDKGTVPYHISNLVFYVFTLAVLGLIYYYAFLPPILEVTTAEFFANFGIGEAVGAFFFLIVILIPLLVLFGAVYHLYKLITHGRDRKTAAE